jgi:hypothetical protein
MWHQSRNQRTLPPFDKITTHCRRAVLGIISPLIAMTVAGMPATAQVLPIGFAEAQAHGAAFEIIANRTIVPCSLGPTRRVGPVLSSTSIARSSPTFPTTQ